MFRWHRHIYLCDVMYVVHAYRFIHHRRYWGTPRNTIEGIEVLLETKQCHYAVCCGCSLKSFNRLASLWYIVIAEFVMGVVWCRERGVGKEGRIYYLSQMRYMTAERCSIPWGLLTLCGPFPWRWTTSVRKRLSGKLGIDPMPVLGGIRWNPLTESPRGESRAPYY